MADSIFHIRIKKDYAASLLEHLQKEQAIEIVEDDSIEIPDWQREAVLKTLEDVRKRPEQLQPWDVVKQKYKRP